MSEYHFLINTHLFDPVGLIAIRGTPTDRQWERSLTQVSICLGQPGDSRRGYIIDLSAMEGISAKQRMTLGRWRAHHRDAQGTNVTALAYLTPSRIVRGMVTASFWARKPASPAKMFADFAEAQDWLRQHLNKDGIPWPTTLSDTTYQGWLKRNAGWQPQEPGASPSTRPPVPAFPPLSAD